jgi:hypothetical protein
MIIGREFYCRLRQLVGPMFGAELVPPQGFGILGIGP